MILHDYLPRQFQARAQGGGMIVEFALVCLVFIPLILGMIEFGRIMFVYNTMQEVSRRAARAAVIKWTDDASQSAIRKIALFGSNKYLPGATEIDASNIDIEYLTEGLEPISNANMPTSPGDNMAACADIDRAASCIAIVRVKVSRVTFKPLTGFFDVAGFTVPTATVTMHAESLGFND